MFVPMQMWITAQLKLPMVGHLIQDRVAAQLNESTFMRKSTTIL